MILHLKGIIDDWLEEYPAIASKIEEAGFTRTVCRKSQKKKWRFCGGYALNGFLPQGTPQLAYGR
jgi:hypothetical protein